MWFNISDWSVWIAVSSFNGLLAEVSIKNWSTIFSLKVSLTDSENTQYKDYMYDHDMRHQRPLKLKKKFYEFYTAPITKFWADSVGFIATNPFDGWWLIDIIIF